MEMLRSMPGVHHTGRVRLVMVGDRGDRALFRLHTSMVNACAVRHSAPRQRRGRNGLIE